MERGNCTNVMLIGVLNRSFFIPVDSLLTFGLLLSFLDADSNLDCQSLIIKLGMEVHTSGATVVCYVPVCN